MTCLFDPVGCVLNALPWWAPWAFWGCVALIVFGAAWKFVVFAKSLGGGPAAAGAVGIVATVLAVVASILRPGKRAPTADKPDPFKPRNFGIPRKPSTLREPGEPTDDWFKRVTGQKQD